MRPIIALALALLAPMAFAALPTDPEFTVTLNPTFTSGQSYAAEDVDAVQIFCNSDPAGAVPPTSVTTTPRLETTSIDPATFPDVLLQGTLSDFPPGFHGCAARVVVMGEASALSVGVTFETFDPEPNPPGNLTVE